MKDQLVNCPFCGKEFPLSQGVIDHLRKDISEEVESEIIDRMQKNNAEKVQELHEQIQQKNDQIEGFKKIEKDLRVKNRDLEEKEKDIELEIMRRTDAEKTKIEENAIMKYAEKFKFREKEKDKQIDDFKKKVDELNSKLEQKSQQLIGEVAELELEDILKKYFPLDEIIPVGKGKRGADVIQRVKNNQGQLCGSIIWESKNTKNWSDKWINKLKEDFRQEKADIAVIASSALPDGIVNFDFRDGVWIASFNLIYEVALILRQHILELYGLRQAQIGMGEKVDLLYEYLCGNEFKQRIISMVESFTEMRRDLNRERQSMEQIWSKREKQIQKFVKNISGMYGDVKGIIGGALPLIEPLELPLLNDGEKT